MPTERPTITPEVHAEVALLARRAGLNLDPGEVDALAVPFVLMQPALQKLHGYPFDETEPIVTLDARFPERMP
jgi:hypothetical protein